MVHSSQGRKQKNKKLWQNLVVPLEVSSSITEELGPPNSGVNHALKIHAEDKAFPEDKAVGLGRRCEFSSVKMSI